MRFSVGIDYTSLTASCPLSTNKITANMRLNIVCKQRMKWISKWSVFGIWILLFLCIKEKTGILYLVKKKSWLIGELELWSRRKKSYFMVVFPPCLYIYEKWCTGARMMRWCPSVYHPRCFDSRWGMDTVMNFALNERLQCLKLPIGTSIGTKTISFCTQFCSRELCIWTCVVAASPEYLMLILNIFRRFCV